MESGWCFVCVVLFGFASSTPIINAILDSTDLGVGLLRTDRVSGWSPQEEVETPGDRLFRAKRQSIIADIFQIPIQTLTAVGQLFSAVRNQRDKRRNPNNNNNNNVNNGYNHNNDNSGYHNNINDIISNNNGYNLPASTNNPATSYNSKPYDVKPYNMKPYSSGMTPPAFGIGYNSYSEYQAAYSKPVPGKPSYDTNKPTYLSTGSNQYNSGSDNIGANAFSTPNNDDNDNHFNFDTDNNNNNNNNNNDNNNGFDRPFHYLSQYLMNNRVSRTHGAQIAGLSEASDGSAFKI